MLLFLVDCCLMGNMKLTPCQSASTVPAPEEMSHREDNVAAVGDGEDLYVAGAHNFDQALMTTNAVAFDEPCIEHQEPPKQQTKKEDEAVTHQQPKQDGFPQGQSPYFHETSSYQVNNITSSVAGDTAHALMSPHVMSNAISCTSTRLAGYPRCKSTMSESTIDVVSPEYKPHSQPEEPSNTTDNSFTTEREPPEQPPMEDIEPTTHTQLNQEEFPQYPPPHHQMGEPVGDIEVVAYFSEHKGGSAISCVKSTTLHSAGIELYDKDDFTASELVETEDVTPRRKSNDIAQKELKIDGSPRYHSSLLVSSEDAKPAKSKRTIIFPLSKGLSKSNNNDDINTSNDKKQEEQKCNEAPHKYRQSSSTPPPIISDKPGHLESSAPHGKTYVSPKQKKLFLAVETLKTKEAVASAKREFGIIPSYFLFSYEFM
jgi:hypothetical protein